jgi:hypothetical protein
MKNIEDKKMKSYINKIGHLKLKKKIGDELLLWT